MLRSLGRAVGAAPGLCARTFASASSSGVQVACLDEARSVIRIEGPRLIDFLQKIIASDARQLRPGGPPLYAAVLSPQGRYLHDMFLHPAWERGKGQVPAVLADVDATQRRALMDLLQRYSLHHQVDITSAAKGYSAWAAFGPGVADAASSPERAWPDDPRLPALGRRTVLPRGAAPAHTASWADYQLWRMQQGVAEGDTEIPTGQAHALEFNLNRLGGVSFDKGCYVGQEFVQRVHVLGTVRKRLMPFRIGEARGAGCLGAVPLDVTRSHIFDVADADESLRPIGKVHALSVAGGWGLARLRLKEAMAALCERSPLLIGDLEAGTGYAEVWPLRPAWWPDSWGQEEGFEQEQQRRRAA